MTRGWRGLLLAAGVAAGALDAYGAGGGAGRDANVVASVPCPDDCDDGDKCTADACNPVTGRPYLAIPCADGKPCTTESCAAAGSQHVNDTARCSLADQRATGPVIRANGAARPSSDPTLRRTAQLASTGPPLPTGASDGCAPKRPLLVWSSTAWAVRFFDGTSSSGGNAFRPQGALRPVSGPRWRCFDLLNRCPGRGR